MFYSTSLSTIKVLIAAAVIPAIFLLWYAIHLDRQDDREPMSLLLKLVGLGALACIPAAILESPAGALVNSLFDGSTVAYYAVYATLVPGLIEEGCKLAMLYWATSRNQNFNSDYDGILYAVAVTLGFAALENILYVWQGGLATAVARAYSSIPGHMFFGIVMGCQYSRWHRTLVLKKQRTSLLPCLIAPMLVHGLYDFFAFLETCGAIYWIGLRVVIVTLDVLCFVILRRAAKRDRMYWERYYSGDY